MKHVSLLLLLLILAAPLSAQDDGYLRFASADGVFAIQYPTEWGSAEYRTVGDPAVIYAAIFPGETRRLSVMVMDVTSAQVGLPFDLDTADEYMFGARSGHAAIVGIARLIEVEELRVGEVDAVGMTAALGGIVMESICMALNDNWIAIASIEALDVEGIAQHEAEAVAALGSLRFALGESYIESPSLRVNLPREWVLSASEQSSSLYRFVLRPSGRELAPTSWIIVLLNNLDHTSLLSVIRSQGLEGGLVQLTEGDTDPFETERLTIGSHALVRAEAYLPGQQTYNEFHLFMVNQTWLVSVTGGGLTREDAQATLPYIERIIAKLEITITPAPSAAYPL